MGAVYRARDGKLDRDVAIKVLLAALHHPHIATIFGLERGAIVMELVEGTPLCGPVPLGRQIAVGLESAHEKGYRPPRFEAGKHPGDRRWQGEDSGLWVGQGDRTNPGDKRAFADADHVSPEQAAGKPVDGRSDIWACMSC